MLGNKRLEDVVGSDFASFLYQLCLHAAVLRSKSYICRGWQEVGLSALICVIGTFLLIFELPSVQNIFCIRLFKK